LILYVWSVSCAMQETRVEPKGKKSKVPFAMSEPATVNPEDKEVLRKAKEDYRKQLDELEGM
jgi:hypothetical protein